MSPDPAAVLRTASPHRDISEWSEVLARFGANPLIHEIHELARRLKRPVVASGRAIRVDGHRHREQPIEPPLESLTLTAIAREEVAHREAVRQLGAVPLHPLLLLAGRFVQVIRPEA